MVTQRVIHLPDEARWCLIEGRLGRGTVVYEADNEDEVRDFWYILNGDMSEEEFSDQYVCISHRAGFTDEPEYYRRTPEEIARRKAERAEEEAARLREAAKEVVNGQW